MAKKSAGSSSSASAVDAWFQSRNEFAKPICEALREIVQSAAPDLEEAIRWSVPTYKGQGLVCAIGGFKEHVSLVFFRGAELDDPRSLFVKDAGSSSSRAIQFRSIREISPAPLKDLIQRAEKLDASGTPKPEVKRAEVPVPPALQKALAKNKAARQTFEALPLSQRREYSEWIAGARKEETMQRRLKKTLEKLAAGEGLHDKYRKK